MEDVLSVYHLPYDPAVPQICMDETCKQLVGETRLPVPGAPGRPLRYDDEYVRHGVAQIFLFVEPLTGWRRVAVTETRTRKDWAQQVRHLLEVDFPHAKRVRLVMDNLNTHSVASLYEAFPPVKARELAERLETHYTPKHGSWLNMAEIEFSAMSAQCLDRRIPDGGSLREAISAWEADRNARTAVINWRFTTDDARIKLRSLYPKI
jgi:hypothetical protein